MGNLSSQNAVQEPAEQSRKRNIEEVEDHDKPSSEELLHTPKKRKIKSTSHYIYKTLFEKGENSDVIIEALGTRWLLHKVYLCQSGYFNSMFKGSWIESSANVIKLAIPDENINQEALNIAFGSLYHDDVSITPSQVTHVLAAGTLLNLEGLINQCGEIMKETISKETVATYHTASMMYGLQDLTQQCMEWLEQNVMSSQTPDLLKDTSLELMKEIVSSANLLVIQVEMDIYTMLKKWMFLQLHSDWSGSVADLATESEAYFKSKREYGRPYLTTEEGSPFTEVFECLRLHHIINDWPSACNLEADGIIPQVWMARIYRQQWIQMLKVEQGKDKGPEEKDMEIFEQEALRVGRVLTRDAQYCWRWTGFNYGLDVLMSVSNRVLTIKRNTTSQSFTGSVSHRNRRRIMYRITVTCPNEHGQSTYTKTSGKRLITLNCNEEAIVMSIDRKAKFPMHISASFMYYSPICGSNSSQASSAADHQEADDTVNGAAGSGEDEQPSD